MAAKPCQLDRLKIQTARMLEIYALLQREIEGTGGLPLAPETRARLTQAIDTIAANMQQIQEYFARHGEEPAPADPGSPADLDEILEAVLKWHLANEEGE
jgi:hypothetical protein